MERRVKGKVYIQYSKQQLARKWFWMALLNCSN